METIREKKKFPNLEVGISMEYECVLKKVSLSHGKKISLRPEFSNSFRHDIVSPFCFVYGSHNNTYSLLISKILISNQFLYFKMDGVKMFPGFILFHGQIEKQPYIYFRPINFICFFPRNLGSLTYFSSFTSLIFNRKRQKCDYEIIMERPQKTN